MNAERLDLITQILHSALERETGERAAFLDEACAGDEALRQEVESLLQSHEKAGSFLQSPPIEVAAELLAKDRAEAMIGRSVGPFQIDVLLGTGGMGEVYRATDTRLGRTVALKILPARLSHNTELRERLEREARAISRLSHPNVCTLYDIGRHEDLDYLVMEYLEGETLEERLTRGALPLDEALRCGLEMAGALQAAHRQGITHRDIKPGNIMLVRGGCKVLDFGLAKLIPAATSPSSPLTERTQTAKGTILGTLPYMAPEQLEGRAADARSDIFALGAVLYEMITGRRAFEGKSQASLIAAIMSTAPPVVSTLQPLSSEALDRLVRRCLAKDPEDRWQTALDVKEELQWVAEGAGKEASVDQSRSKATGRRAWIWAVGSGVVGVAAGALFFRGEDANNEPETSFGIDLPDDVALAPIVRFGAPAVAPDGSGVVFAGVRNGKVALYFRHLNSRVPRRLEGTEDAQHPFWSHDSRRLGFFAGGKLQTISRDGDSRMEICPVRTLSQGGTWNRDGDIVFAPNARSALFRVSEKDKTPRMVTTLEPGVGEHVWPCFLPDGRHFLYLQAHRRNNTVVAYIGSLDTTEPPRILPDHQHESSIIYAAGHLLYVKNNNLMARPFDASTLEWAGAEVQIASDVGVDSASRAHFSCTGNGTLVYYGQGVSRIVKYDRKGTRIRTIGADLQYHNLRLSPRGDQASYLLPNRFPRKSESRQLWVLNLESGQPTPYNDDPTVGLVDISVFSPNEKDVFFWGRWGNPASVYRMSFSTEKPIPVIERGFIPLDVSRDGRFLLLKSRGEGENTERENLFYAELIPGKLEYEPIEFVKSAYHEKQGRFSPDSRWVVYTSNESGQDEVWVRTFAGGKNKTLISGEEGGSFPAWIKNKDGEEIVYLSGTRTLMSVAVDTSGSMLKKKGTPAVVFKPPETSLPSGSGDDYRWWDITADGRFIYVIVNDRIPITVVKPWTDRLKH